MRLLPLRPFQPLVGHPDDGLAEVDHLASDPGDCHRETVGQDPCHMRPLSSALIRRCSAEVTGATALRQLFERLLYAQRTEVATRRQGYSFPRALRHKVSISLKFLSFLLRYPLSWRSRRGGFSGRLTADLFLRLCAVTHINPSTVASLNPGGLS